MTNINIKRIAGGKTILYQGRECLLLHADGRIEPWQESRQARIRLAVIGREHYFEIVRHFPFAESREIRAAVATDPEAYCPFAARHFMFTRLQRNEEGSLVNLWFLRPEFKLPSGLVPWLLLPETVLLSRLLRKSPAYLNLLRPGDENQKLSLHLAADGALRSLLLDNTDPAGSQTCFRRIIGGDPDLPREDCNEPADFAGLIFRAWEEMPPRRLPAFLNPALKDPETRNLKPLRYGLAAAGLLLLLYTGITIGYPLHLRHRLQGQNQQLEQSLAALLAQQRGIDSRREELQQLRQPFLAYSGRLGLLQMLNRVLPPKTLLKQIQISDEVVELQGEAPRASTLLAALDKEKQVQGARFSAPLRNLERSGREAFKLVFAFTAEEEPAEKEPAKKEPPGKELPGKRLPGKRLPGKRLPGKKLPGKKLQ